MSHREISNLQSMEGIFIKKEPIKKHPKRRHIFSSILSAISEEKESGTMLRNSCFIEGELSNDMPNLIDYETLIQNDNSANTMPEINLIEKSEETPVQILQERLNITSREYYELLEFTRFEKSARLSIEQEMAYKFKILTEECSNLKASLRYAESKNQTLILEHEKSMQLINDYEYIIESQKMRYEKRENELLEQINETNLNRTSEYYSVNENISIHMPQIDTFEYEEMIDTIESLKKQNEELQEVIESINLRNADLQNNHNLKSGEIENQEANKSLKLLNTDLQNRVTSVQSENLKLHNTICTFELQESQLQTRNKSLQSECLEFEPVQDNTSSANSSFVSSLQKEILELRNKVYELESDLVEDKSELTDSLDALYEVTEDLDMEEQKCSELQNQLETEQKKCEELEIKLEQKENFQRAIRRFSSDSLIHQKCKSLDSSVLHLLFNLKSILDPKTKQKIETCGNPSSSSEHCSSFNLPKVPRETEQILTGNFSSDSSKLALSLNWEKLKSFSNCYFEDSTSSTEFLNYFQSVLTENSTLSEENARLKTSLGLHIEGKKDPSNEVEKLKNEMSSTKMEWQSDITKISNLQKQLEQYNYRNLSDSEKIEKTNENSITSTMGTLESLQAEKLNSFLLIENLDCENTREKLKLNNLQEIYISNCSKLEERNNQIESLSENSKKLSNNIGLLNSQITAQEIQINDQHQLIDETVKYQTIIEEENKIPEKMSKDLNTWISLKENQFFELHGNVDNVVEGNENFKVLIENFNLLKIEIETIHRTLIEKVESEKQDLQELLKQTREILLLQIDCLNRNIEKNEIEIETLTSEMYKVVSEKNSTLKLMKKLEKENIEMKENNNTLIKRLEVLNSNDGIVEKMYVEIFRLKGLVLPEDGPKKPTPRQLLISHRSKSNNMMKLEEMKYLVDEVCSLVQERNLVKHRNEDKYESLQKIHNNMKREFEVKKGQYELVIANLNALEDEHLKVRENYDTSKSEVEQLKSFLKKMKSKHEIYESKIENLSFENRDLSKKLSQMEKLKLSCKEFEILKYEYEQLKITHQSCEEQTVEIKSTTICKNEDKWKQQRKKTHDSRRSIDLDTLCVESVVDTCNNCQNMSQQLQKIKSEMLQLRKYIESMSTSEFETLKCKYEKMKKLCRMRNDEIAKLKQNMLELK